MKFPLRNIDSKHVYNAHSVHHTQLSPKKNPTINLEQHKITLKKKKHSITFGAHQLTVIDHILHTGMLLVRNIADSSKGEYTHQQARDRIHKRYGQRIVQKIVVVFIVAGKRNHRTECDAK